MESAMTYIDHSRTTYGSQTYRFRQQICDCINTIVNVNQGQLSSNITDEPSKDVIKPGFFYRHNY